MAIKLESIVHPKFGKNWEREFIGDNDGRINIFRTVGEIEQQAIYARHTEKDIDPFVIQAIFNNGINSVVCRLVKDDQASIKKFMARCTKALEALDIIKKKTKGGWDKSGPIVENVVE